MTGSVLTVTANPALDKTYVVEQLNPGDSHRVPPPVVRAGGKGMNVARVAHQLGASVLAVATCGGSSGRAYREDLDRSGIPHRLVPVEPATRHSLAFVDRSAGATSIFNETGSALSSSEWRALEQQTGEHLRAAGCLVGSGSLPPQSPADFYPGLVRAASRRGVPCIIDTSGPDLIRAAEAGVFAVKPNHRELLEATGEANPQTAARVLIARGAGVVFLSCGEDGMLAFTSADPGHFLQARLGHALKGNPTGAGDAAVAAIAVLLAAGCRDVTLMLRTAAAWSSAAVLMPAAGEISPEHRSLIRRITVTRHHDGEELR
ncbi:1-phosphofructokinase family hexose kinase [Arthrobacter sp. zg-Y1110]|uniref:1-phosphofructokinase family hexose kinase n=1 Tax=Arthrobacter sp. zg-Y1110 TaxID=2886932 RepID=UPI001D15CB4C|nr:hexose kinase [Arthrobacter sp. zg-Y1110]MCC3291672.1 hexose kinase [Arthrobacter sp. zg-Y1110]UWX85515.1 hexose kinase [Arthrobacter sp. zg-Y1110]